MPTTQSLLAFAFVAFLMVLWLMGTVLIGLAARLAFEGKK